VDLINLAIKTIFTENAVLAFFLGMCSFLAVSKKIKTAIGLGFAVVFVSGITVPANWFVYHYFLREGALSWAGFPGIDLSFLTLIAHIAVIAAMVQLVEMIVEKVSDQLYNSLGIFLPLIAVNCAILGGSSFMVQREYTLIEASVYGVSNGFGFMLAIVAIAAIRQKIRYSHVPDALKGLGITMLVTGLMAIAFLGFSGIKL
jgi:Na+-transporting NADH:ubiquinone oxidoreductase subunit E